MFSEFKRCLVDWKIYLATTITFSLCIHPASAETVSADTESAGKFITANNLQEITVTATRTSRKVSEVPESVSVVNTGQIRARQAADFGDILRYLPNVELGGRPRNLGLSPGEHSGIRIRGGFQSMNEQYSPGISVYGLVGEQFDYLLDFSYHNAADDIRHGDGSRLQNSRFESYAGLAKFNWTPGNHRFTFSTQTFDQTGQIPANAQATSTPATLVDRDTTQHNYTLRYRYENPGNTWLKPEVLVYHNTTYSLEKRLLDQRHDETDFSTTGINARNSSHLDLNSFATQLLTYGIDYFHNETRGKRNGAPRPEFPRGSTDVVGAFLQDEITLWERLSLIPSVRWDYFHSQADGLTAGSNENNRANIKIGGLLKVTEWLSITAGYNEAFRALTLSELFTTGTHFTCGRGCANLFIPNPNLKPETTFNKEIGVRIQKSDLLFEDDQLTMRSTYFHNRVKDFVDLMVAFVFFPIPGNSGKGGVTTSGNVRDAMLEGFEMEANYAAKYGYTGFSYAQTRGYNRTAGGALSNIHPDKWIVMAGLNWPAYDLSLAWLAQQHRQSTKPRTGRRHPYSRL